MSARVLSRLIHPTPDPSDPCVCHVARAHAYSLFFPHSNTQTNQRISYTFSGPPAISRSMYIYLGTKGKINQSTSFVSNIFDSDGRLTPLSDHRLYHKLGFVTPPFFV